MKHITESAYYMGRDSQYPDELTDEMRGNARETCAKTNQLLDIFYAQNPDASETAVNSGWRPAGINASTPGAAKKSKHMTCQAIDLEDSEGELDDWCMKNQGILAQVGLWLEHPGSTKGWCHLQIVPPKSGNRVFYP